MFYGNLQNLVIRSKSVIKSSLVIRSQTGVISDQLRVSVLDALSAGTITKFSWRQESLRTTSGSQKMDSDLVLTECFSRRTLRFTTLPIYLIHSERVSSSTSSFLANCLAYASHVSMIISKFWCHGNERGSVNFGPLRKRYLSLSFCTIPRSPVTTWPHGAYRNSELEQVRGRGS